MFFAYYFGRYTNAFGGVRVTRRLRAVIAGVVCWIVASALLTVFPSTEMFTRQLVRAPLLLVQYGSLPYAMYAYYRLLWEVVWFDDDQATA